MERELTIEEKLQAERDAMGRAKDHLAKMDRGGSNRLEEIGETREQLEDFLEEADIPPVPQS